MMQKSGLANFLLPFLGSSTKRGQGNCIYGEGMAVSQILELPPFRKIKVGVDAKVMLTQGPEQIVELRAQPNILAAIINDSRMKNDCFDFRVKGCIEETVPIELDITLPILEAVTVDSDSKVFTTNTFHNLTALRLDAVGDADFFMAMQEVGQLALNAEGDGRYQLNGSAQHTTINISGDARVENYDLRTQLCDIRISGDGKCQVTVDKKLHVRISGDGEVYYRGNPVVSLNLSGDGRVKQYL